MQSNPTSPKRPESPNDRMRALFRAVGVKGQIAQAAVRELRLTPEYEQARREGRARDWLNKESHSFAEAAYDLLINRDLEP